MERIDRNNYLSFLENHPKVSRSSQVLPLMKSKNIFAKDGDKFIIATTYDFVKDKIRENLPALTLLTNEFLNTTNVEVILATNYNEIWEQIATPEDRKELAEAEERKQLEQEQREKEEEEYRQEKKRQNIQRAYDTFRKYTMVDATKYELDDMVKSEGNAKAIMAVREWMKEPEHNRVKTHHFLTLVGECGRGKTHLALCIANEYLKKPNNIDWWSTSVNSVDYFQVANLLTQLKAGFNDNSNDDIMQRCNYSNLLILDDLGMQRDTDWALEQLDMIIDNRYIKKQDTIFTTNMKLSELPKRIASRLAEGDSYVIGGEDFRAIKAKERKRK